MSEEVKIPKRVFIVPYRNRVQHKFFFSKYMSFILENDDDYEIYFSHQCDSRTFNRGGTRNIGFLAIKNKYPNHYKNIDFVFNDVDTIPFNKIFDYKTSEGIVKHYYGFKYTLGGIVVIKGSDFEKINGYPNFWGWGMEDNALQKRALAFHLKIDRTVFYNIGSPEILQLFDGVSRIISKKDPWRAEHDDGVDGLRTIKNLQYNIDDKSLNPNDNIFTVHNNNIFFINITTFTTLHKFEGDNYYSYDLREPKRKIINPDKLKETKQTVITTDNWSKIPYYPTIKERREHAAKYLISIGKTVPGDLLRQIEQDNIKEIQEDSYNNFNNQYNQQIQTQKYSQQIPHKYSREYATYLGQRPKAQTSARVKLGGAY
uniref:Galactosyltransferase C-terminal domain-containing protein n=1 Tax=viral metagenome TaxID=1070528 RepID=A0A6C0EQX6_9ZZZZ